MFQRKISFHQRKFFPEKCYTQNQDLSKEVLYSKPGSSTSSLFPVIFTQICKHRKTKNQCITLLFFCRLQYLIKFFSFSPIWILFLMMPRGGKKLLFFFVFSKTYLNINFWKVYRCFFLKKKKKLQTLSLSVLILCSFKYCFSEGN